MIGANEYNSPSAIPNNNEFAPQSKNLAAIIRGYKSAVTTYARKNGIEFDSQLRYHERIIPSMHAYHQISKYIANNPDKWRTYPNKNP